MVADVPRQVSLRRFPESNVLSYYVIIIFIYNYTYNRVISICIDLSKIKLFVFVYVYYHEQNVRIIKRNIISSAQNRRGPGAFVTSYDIPYITLTI